VRQRGGVGGERHARPQQHNRRRNDYDRDSARKDGDQQPGLTMPMRSSMSKSRFGRHC
jgi:hypothetical protein